MPQPQPSTLVDKIKEELEKTLNESFSLDDWEAGFDACARMVLRIIENETSKSP